MRLELLDPRAFPLMTRQAIRVATTLLAGAAAAGAQTPGERIDAYLRARTDLGQFSGAVLVAKGGEVLLTKAYGYADFERAVPNAVTSRFLAASLTKQFTAAAIVQLRDAGKLALTDSLCRFVESCPSAWTGVTIDHLIHHTSGIPDYEELFDFGSDAYARHMMVKDNIRAIIDTVRVLPLAFAPGTKYAYNNTGYLLLAKVIERVSGQSYDRYMTDQLFAPLGMKNTGIVTADRSVPGLVTGYSPGSSDASIQMLAAGIPLLKSGAQKSVPPTIMAGAHGEGGMYTTVEDLYRWDRALKGGSVISAASQAEIFKPGLGNYGFGWNIGMRFGESNQWHTGVLPGFVSRIDRYPTSDVTVIVMANIDFARFTQISRDLSALVLGRPYDVPVSRRLVARDRTVEARYVGVYALSLGGGIEVSVKSGARFMELQAPGRFNAGLVPFAEPLRFYVPFLEGDVTFTTDAVGHVTGFTLRYNGETFQATKRG